MACRVGMSTDPDERIQHWKNVEGHTDGVILHRGLTYDEALAKEKSEAEMRGCISHGGGQKISSRNWCVYMVWGGR